MSSPSIEVSDVGYGSSVAVKKNSEPAGIPPKIAELSALEQELQKLHTNRRIAAENAAAQQQQQQQVSTPPQPESHIKTYSEVLQQEAPPVTSGSGQTLAPPQPADQSRVRKISRFNVSVVKEQEKTQTPVQPQAPAPQPTQPVIAEPNPNANNNKQQLNLNLQTAQPVNQQQPVEIMSLMPKGLIGKNKGMDNWRRYSLMNIF